MNKMIYFIATYLMSVAFTTVYEFYVFLLFAANDVILSHMITFLNDKTDHQLRSSFFKAIVGVAAYIGWTCSTLLKPLLQQVIQHVKFFLPYSFLYTVEKCGNQVVPLSPNFEEISEVF